jgi:cellulose synthase operon protein C
VDQQEKFAQMLLGYIASEDESAEQKLVYVEQLGKLDFLTAEYLIPLANHQNALIQEKALRMLGTLDSSKVIPVLIDTLQDKRARISIFALRSAFKAKSKPEALAILEAAPLAKIAVAKEVVRLIGELQTRGALDWLVGYSEVSLHVAVHGALLGATCSYLEHERAWEIFYKAARDPNPITAKTVAEIPWASVKGVKTTKVLALVLQLFNHSNAEVRIAA